MTSVKIFCAATLGIFSLALLTMAGCATAPPTENGKANLSDESHAAFADMERIDPSLQDALGVAYGYAVFPSIGKAGVGVGAANGRGEVYERGKFIGYAELTQGTIGAQLGAET